MTPRNVIRLGSAALCLTGVMLLVATGSVASALGASGGNAVAGASDPASKAFWFQLAFIRLFGTALIGLAAVLLWCHSQLSDAQHRSLAKLLSAVLGVLGLMTVGQQIAIWSSNAGWVLAAELLLTATLCAVSSVRDAMRPAV